MGVFEGAVRRCGYQEHAVPAPHPELRGPSLLGAPNPSITCRADREFRRASGSRTDPPSPHSQPSAHILLASASSELELHCTTIVQPAGRGPRLGGMTEVEDGVGR